MIGRFCSGLGNRNPRRTAVRDRIAAVYLGFNRALFRLPDARGPSDQPDKDLTAVVRPHGRTTWVRMLELSFWPRVSILIGLLVAGLLGLLALGPIPQSPDYHRFADTRSLFGIPSFNDVASNSSFAVVGILGILVVSGKRSRVVLAERSDARPYLAFFIGVALVSVGSAYYHWAPSNDRLLWDRLPMSIAFMAFCSAIIADRIDAKAGNVWLLPMLIGLGLVSLVYWNWTESLGRGDLRFYGFVQFYPMIAIPAIACCFLNTAIFRADASPWWQDGMRYRSFWSTSTAKYSTFCITASVVIP